MQEVVPHYLRRPRGRRQIVQSTAPLIPELPASAHVALVSDIASGPRDVATHASALEWRPKKNVAQIRDIETRH